MGQRLNIEIVNSTETYANAYYHWSAYSGSAMHLTNDIISWYSEHATEYNNPLLLAIKMLEITGAGVNLIEELRITNDSNARLKEFMPQKSIDRSHGLISITSAGIEETEAWEEGRVTIDIEKEIVFFNVCQVLSAEEYDEYAKEGWATEREKLLLVDDHNWCDGESIPFDRFHELIDIYSKTGSDNPYAFRRPDGTVVEWIA